MAETMIKASTLDLIDYCEALSFQFVLRKLLSDLLHPGAELDAMELGQRLRHAGEEESIRITR